MSKLLIMLMTVIQPNERTSAAINPGYKPAPQYVNRRSEHPLYRNPGCDPSSKIFVTAVSS